MYECIFQLTATCDISYWCYLMFSWMCLFQFCYFNKKKTFYFVINIFIQFIQLECEFESRSGRDCQWGGVNVQRSLPLQHHDEVPLSKAPNPQLLPGRRNINGRPLLRVCVHCCVCALGGVNADHEFRVWVTVLGCISLHFIYFFIAFLLHVNTVGNGSTIL